MVSLSIDKQFEVRLRLHDRGDTSCELSNSTLFGWLHLLALLSDVTPNLCCIHFLYWSSYIPSPADSLTQTVESDTQSWQNDSQLETLLDNALQCNVTASLFCDYPSIGILQTWVNIPTKNWRKKGRLSRKKSLNIRKFGSLCPARHRSKEMFNLKACSGFHFLSQPIQCCQSVIRGWL